MGTFASSSRRLASAALLVILLLAVLRTSAQITCVAPAPGLIHWWSAEASTGDSVGSLSGALYGGATYAAGLVGQAFSLDGVNDSVTNAVWGITNVVDSYTMELWAWPTAGRASTGESTSGIAGSGGQRYAIFPCEAATGGIVGAGISIGTNGVSVFEHGSGYLPALLVFNTPITGWTHVAVVYTNRQPKLYLNGVLVRTGLTSGNSSCPSTWLGERGALTANQGFYAGLLDEVSIYNRALSTEEIQTIYNAGSAGKCTPPTAPFIVTQPTNQAVRAGFTASFSVLAGGSPPLSYAWFFETNRVADATNSTLILSGVTTNQAGTYTVEITNQFGLLLSSNAVLTVIPPPPCLGGTGVISWWRGEGNSEDAVGGNAGTVANGTSFAPGVVGQGFLFDGLNDRVLVADAANLNFGSAADFSIEAWVQPIASANAYGVMTILDKRQVVSSVRGYELYLQDGRLACQLAAGSYADFQSAGPDLRDGNFHHVAWTMKRLDPAGGRLYVDAVNVLTFNATNLSGSLSNNQPLRLGNHADGSLNTWFKGVLDEATLYDRALTADEVAALYSAASAGKCFVPAPPIVVIAPTNLSVLVSNTASFTVAVTGTTPIRYQWQFNANDIAFETNASLTLSNVQTNQAGAYRVVLTNAHGFALSPEAQLSVITPACAPTGTGAISWWRAEGDSEDAVGGEGGVLVNGAAFVPGKVGQAFSFDGVNDHVRVADRPGFHVTNALTLEAWVYPTSHGAYHSIISKWDVVLGPKQKSYSFSAQPSGQLSLGLCADGNDAIVGSVISTSTLPLNQWSHVCGTYDGTLIKLFLNGNFQNQTAYTNGILPGTNALGIGGVVGGGTPGQVGSVFAGRIDEPAIYNRALSPSEIKAIYDASYVGKCISPVGPSIASQPVGQLVNLSNAATFRVVVTGTSPFSYQWRLGGHNLFAATNSTLTIANALPSKAGAYSVAVSNASGFAISADAQLKVKVLAATGNGLPLTNSIHTFGTNVIVTLQNFFTNGLVFYTLDGSTPSFFSTLYSGPFLVTQSSTLRALAYSADFFEAGESEPIMILIPPSYPLSLSAGGGGSVSANPTPGPYLSNAVVTLTATPNAGWTLLQWLGDASGASATTNLIMDRAKSAHAIFGTTLSTTAAGGGYVVLNPPGGRYPYGTTVQLSAVPSNGNFFALWGNAGSGNVNPLSYLLTNANPTVSSLFAAVGGGQVALTVVPVGMGSVSASPRANAYATGSGVTLTATPEAGQEFLGWSGDAAGLQNPLPLTLGANALIFANFTHQPRVDVLTAPGRIRAEGLQLKITGRVGDRYELAASTNLFDWATLLTYTNAVGERSFTDGEATNANWRFYRAGVLP